MGRCRKDLRPLDPRLPQPQEQGMIDLYTWTTPNGRKVSIMLEETGLAYRVKPVNIGKGEQFAPDFLAIGPNNRIPAIVDHDGPQGKPMPLFESGAILLYLAYKTGKFLPTGVTQQFQVIQWLMFQMGGIGPMFGQAHHFLRAAPEPVPYAIERYTTEARRLYKVLDRHRGRVPPLPQDVHRAPTVLSANHHAAAQCSYELAQVQIRAGAGQGAEH
jgi:GST-like protein